MKEIAETLTIRPPEAADGMAIAHLFSQLGYPAEGGDVTARLLAPDPASAVLLASLADKVVGVLVWHRLAPLHVAPAWGLISALVVDEGARGAGVGAALLKRAEQMARAAGCAHMELSSSLKREAAHRFYLAQAYQERPKRFIKLL